MPEETKPVDDGAGDPSKDGDKGTDPESTEESKKVTLTQEEVDRIVADRLKRAQPGYEALKAKAEKYDAAEAAKRSETEQAKADKEAAEAAAATRNEKADAKLKRAEILAEAVAQKAADPDIVIAMLMGSGDITVDDDGEVSGVAAAVKKLLKERPILAGGASRNGAGGEFGGNDQTTLDERIQALEAKGDYSAARDLKIQKGLKIGV
jgi:hypothetical protein